MVLNTSFNENEPVVCKPEEALDCFLRTKMDTLVIGHSLITRRADVQAEPGTDEKSERV
jgi:carbamoyltransferase